MRSNPKGKELKSPNPFKNVNPGSGDANIDDDPNDFSSCPVLTLTQLRDEVESDGMEMGEYSAEDDSMTFSSSHSSPSPAVSPTNLRSGWNHTPPDCECTCPKKAYVVFHGRKTGIFCNWSATRAQVNGFSCARFKGYHSVADAEHAHADAVQKGLIGPVEAEWENHHYTVQPRTPCHVAQNSVSGPSPFPASPLTQRTTPASPSTQHTNPASPSTQRTNTFASTSPSTPRTNTAPPPYSTLETIKKEPITPTIPPSSSQNRAARPPSAFSSTGSRARDYRRSVSRTSDELPTIVSPLAGGARNSLATLSARGNQEWWVVCVGDSPGVYQGRSSAFQHAGNSSGVEVFESSERREDANEFFVDFYALHRIHRLRIARGHTFDSPSDQGVPLTSSPNNKYWYVVPQGHNPGVYEGRRTATRMAGDTLEDMVRCETERAAYSLFVNLYMSKKIRDI